jgi:hypothetical protein
MHVFTNADHDNAVSLLKMAHIPDVTKARELLDLVMLGNIIELSRAFALRFEDDLNEPATIEEENTTRWKYRKFIAWFASNYIAVIGNQVVSPWYIFYRSLIDFASTVCAYKELHPDKTKFSLEELRKSVTDHIRADWPMLQERFSQLLASPGYSFRWTGPKFEIWPRDSLPKHFTILELSELDDYPIYGVKDDQEASQDSEDRRVVLMSTKKHGGRSKKPEGPAGKSDDGGDEKSGDEEKSGGEAMDTGDGPAVESEEEDSREVDGDVRMKLAEVAAVSRGTVRARAESSGKCLYNCL